MYETQFWRIIESAHTAAKGKPERQLKLIEKELSKLSPEEILEFQRIFWQQHRISYRADLWGAAYIMNGGCSDDGFDYFRGWLIAQGKDVFEKALQDPDSLADILGDDPEQDVYDLEDMLSVGLEPWQKKTKLDLEDFYNHLGKGEPLPKLGKSKWSDGEGDIDERKGKKLYPKLWAKFDG